ncbi:MAG TPA: methyltransferase domain-containing protein [Candidatus Elarobacter sp.]
MQPATQTAEHAPYAAPVAVADFGECYYYHTMDVPGHGVVEGEWDLRGRADAYLGHEPFAGKRVLEVGTASGFLCFEMERRGAEVVAYDLSGADAWDIVPFASRDVPGVIDERREHIARLNKSWWFNHHALGSRARVVYGSVYAIPRAIGRVDVCTFGAILLHLRDPFLALQNATALEPETVVVTEMARSRWPLSFLERPARRRSPLFLPNAAQGGPVDAWWSFTPEAVSNMLAILGYRTDHVVRHAQRYRQRETPMFTVVARRTAAGASAER